MWRKPVVGLAAAALLMAGCGGDDGNGDGGSGGGDGSGPITMWTVHDVPDKIATMEGVLDDFTAETDIKVELKGVAAPDLPQAMVSAAASGELPDVLLHGNELSAGWVNEGILDPKAATEVINELDPETFSAGALEMVKAVEGEDEYATVPSDGWGQMIFYRSDLYDKAGLDAPETYESILAGAKELSGDGVSGFALGNKGGDGFAAQVFEHFALANDCQLTDDDGNITLDSPNCVEAIEYYTELNQYAPKGATDVESSRANYLAGKVGAMSWSPHFLDELAGLFPDTPPTCAECKNDPAWLAGNTGMVSLVQGPSGDEPTQYGITIGLGITSSADTEPSKELVKYLLGDGYLDFLSISPEGRYPMRSGPEPGDTTYQDGWPDLALGSGQNTEKIRDLYPEEMLNAIAEASDSFEAWGIPQGQGALVTAMRTDLDHTRTLREALDGNITAEEAAQQMQQHAEQVQSELGG